MWSYTLLLRRRAVKSRLCHRCDACVTFERWLFGGHFLGRCRPCVPGSDR